MTDNPYLLHIKSSLPRVLSLFDNDRTSNSYGLGDRYYWAWGLIDFPNGTYQGIAHGLSLLWTSGLWPYNTDPKIFLLRIDSIFQAAARITRSNGSLEEAFPFEGSYCVTALVAFDLIASITLLDRVAPPEFRERWKGIVEPLARYLIASDETHGIISNHLATAIAALVRWEKLSGDKKALKKAEVLLERIRKYQSPEGWLLEYQGADPGYQSLCLYYLADAYLLMPELGIYDILVKATRFLLYFAHPDGSFGGVYGSRNTRFYNPAGLLALADILPEARTLSYFMAQSIQENKVVTLSSIDESNLIPWFNSYCWAATLYKQCGKPSGILHFQCDKRERIHFPGTGILIDKGPRHYTVINTHKGGAFVHFINDKKVVEDCGLAIRYKNGKISSTQIWDYKNRFCFEGDTLTVSSYLYESASQQPTVLSFILLRVCCLTLFRVQWLREKIKQLLVRLLITKQKKLPILNNREIQLGEMLTVYDSCELPSGYKKIEVPGPFVAIHMASQGYWQIQDEEGLYDSKV